MDNIKMICGYKDQLITAHSFKNRTFLTNCIQEKVIPTSISSILCPSQHIFPHYIRLYLETSICDFKFSEAHVFERARLIGLELRRKQGMSHNMADQLRSEISRINNSHISKLRSKFISLCNKSRWNNLGRADLVNISSISFSPVETKALSFRLKFATGIKNHMGKLINTNYKHHDFDFHKGFLQGIIAASTNCHSDELTLPNRYITALKSLSSNHNIIISLSDKCGGVVIMESTVYNQNLWIYLVITTLMNRYPYKQFQIILTTLTNPTEN